VEHGIPHSQLLGWSESDRVKLLAYLMDEATRCVNCGTAEWEWAEDPNRYYPGVHVCRGCALRETRREDLGDTPGATIVLLSGAAKAAALAREREAYLASHGQKGG
jgi:hypothetical protein